MKKIFKTIALLGAAMSFSCTHLEVTMPKGPQGEQGAAGRDGLSSYEVWVKAVQAGTIPGYSGSTEINDFFIYLKGKDGKDGKDGKSAYEVWKDSVSEGVADPKNPGQTWPKEKTTVQDFYSFLTGKDGDDGLTPYVGGNGNWFIGGKDTGVPARGQKGETGAAGQNGADGKDGRSAYEVWKEIAVTGSLDDPHNPGQKWPGENVSVQNFFEYLSGVDGKDGETPYVGGNGNWFIGTTDTGVAAQGPKGDTGASGTDGLSAYELWKKDVTGAGGLDDPHNPGQKWDKEKTGIADFWRYLQGKDGSDGKDGENGRPGKSAYELWKEIVDRGEMDNPKTDDPDDFWNKDNNTIEWFWEYLKGKDGKDGTPGVTLTVQDTAYVQEAVPGKYNVAPVRSLVRIDAPTATQRDTTYEFVNPYTGGEALIVTGPGPVIIPNCTVTFTDGQGRSYTKTSDREGYIYLKRSELPVYQAGNPGMLWTRGDKENGTRPTRFKYGTVEVTDPAKIAATCKVSYRVELVSENEEAEIRYSEYDHVDARHEIGRRVEGTAVPAIRFSDGKTSRAYLVSGKLADQVGYFKFCTPQEKALNGGMFPAFDRSGMNISGKFPRYAWNANAPESRIEQLVSGDGQNPETVNVHFLEKNGGTKPDYGTIVNGTRVDVPVYWPMGGLDVTGLKGGDEPDVSYNGKKVSDLNSDGVPVNRTNYELILGQTSFSFRLDMDTFGPCYVNETRKGEDGVIRFKRYSSLREYLQEFREMFGAYVWYDKPYQAPHTIRPGETMSWKISDMKNSGNLGGVGIKNEVDIPLYFSLEKGFTFETELIRNVYDGFLIEFRDFRFPDIKKGGSGSGTITTNPRIFYKGKNGRFHYRETAAPFVASCDLGSTCEFQAIKDAVSAPYPQP